MILYRSELALLSLALHTHAAEVKIKAKEAARAKAFLDVTGERAPRTQIVAIGSAGGIDAGLLERTFASCISAAAAQA